MLLKKKYFTKKKIFSDKNLLKINYRIKSNKKNYNQNICKIIKKKPTPESKNNYIKLLNKYKIKKFSSKMIFNIYPFCNEKVKISKKLDMVNKYKINKYLIKIIEDKFNCNFVFDYKYFEIGKKNYRGQPNNSSKFIQYILKKNNKNHFIISHSNFMIQLSSYIEKKYFNIKYKNKHIFDNLDILQIVIQDKKIKYCMIRRFSDNYILPSDFIDNDKKISKDTYSVFLMRHCSGCHNITKNIFTKIKYGYGLYSSCFIILNKEMKNKSPYLKKIIKDYGGVTNFSFGSSIIFRSILTIIKVFGVIQ